MEAKFKRPNGRDGALFSLNAAIDALDLARDAASVKPAKDVFGSTSTLLARIRVRFLRTRVRGLLTDAH